MLTNKMTQDRNAECDYRLSGMTLLEVIVALSVFMILSGIVIASTMYAMRVSAECRDRIRMHQVAEILVADISTYLKEADTVSVYPDGRAVKYRTREASICCFWDKAAGKVRCVCDDSELSNQKTTLNPPDIQVVNCLFVDAGSKIIIDLVLEKKKLSIGSKTVYRIKTDVAVPNRSQSRDSGSGVATGAVDAGTLSDSCSSSGYIGEQAH